MPSSPPAPLRRFEFVDGPTGTGYWTAGVNYNDVYCAAGGYVYFQWYRADHDLVLMPNKAAYDSCDFSAATTLMPEMSPGSPNGLTSYYLPCDTPGATMYLTCSVSSHCYSAQRVTVHVSSSEFVYNTSDPDKEVLIHSDSLARVHTLLGQRTDSTTGFSYFDLGYHSEAAANATLDMVWCLPAHCPTSAQDVDQTATYDSCMADVYNIGGFVSRKRPVPQFEHAEAYYMTALSHVPGHCNTLEYLSELYLMQNNASAAEATALRLCNACGATSSTALQAKEQFDQRMSVTWPCGESTAEPEPEPEGLSMGAVAGGVGGGVGGVIVLGLAYYFFYSGSASAGSAAATGKVGASKAAACGGSHGVSQTVSTPSALA